MYDSNFTGNSMKKNVCKSVRINSEKMKLLEKHGMTLQQLVDWAIDQKIKEETKLVFKK